MAGKLWDKTCMPDATTTQLDWVKENSHLYTIDELAEMLGRTPRAVESQLFRSGLQYKGQIGTMSVEEPAMVAGLPTENILNFMKDTPRSLEEMSRHFDRSRETMRHVMERLLELSYNIVQSEEAPQQYLWSTKVAKIVAPPTILWDKDTWDFKLGAMGDWHDGSKAAQISARNRAIKEMYECGVRDIIVTGDINAGRKVYRGQEADNVSMSPDDQTAITEAHCPRYDGLRYHIMGGNHDWSFVKEGTHDALDALCKRRDDFLWYGYDLVTVHLTEEVDALAWHPRGAQSYAMSYRSQKFIEQVAFQELLGVLQRDMPPKVRFLFAGHWHGILMGYWKGPIYIQHTGGFEGQNNLTRGLGVFPELGAVILEGSITKDRNIIRDMSIRYLRFTEIENDYLNYPIPVSAEREPEFLFQWVED